MKFERKHQMVKNFTNNTNYLNICKTIAEKYSAKLNLENSNMLEYTEHKLLKNECDLKFAKDGKVSSIDIRGVTLKNNNTTYLMKHDGEEIFKLKEIIYDGNVKFFCSKLSNIQKHNDLMAISFDSVDTEISTLRLEDIELEVGHLYSYCNKDYVFFNYIWAL